ncbi:MAG: ROK family protein, partial [Anaerolineae bacterium]
MARLILALDFGGTKNSAALTGVGEREWLNRKRQFSPAQPSGAYDWQTMIALGRDLLQGAHPAAIGVSFGGPVRASRGQVILSHHVPGWENFPLTQRLQEEFGAPAVVDNDANVAALGEARLGAGRDASSVFYVTVSTGVGGGWVLDDRIWHGHDEMAGEIGHLQVDPNGPVCICGRRGCVEVMACGPSIARFARERLQNEPARGRLLRERLEGDLSRVTAQIVNQAALDGDELAGQVMDHAARALGLGLGSAIVLMNPERIVVGGGVSKSGPHYFDVIRAAARGNCLPEMRVDIVPAKLGDDAPLWGAAAL